MSSLKNFSHNKKRVVLLTLASFPVGNVSTLRYTSYLKSLYSNDVEPYVVIYSPSNMARQQPARKGTVDGIKFFYSTKPTWTYGCIPEKIIYLIIGIVSSIRYLNKISPDVIILYGDNLFIINIIFGIYAKLKSIKYIGDRSELPPEKIRDSRWKMLLYGLKQKMFDGMIIMTKQLMQFYGQYSKNPHFCFFMPMTIDPSRFKGLTRKNVAHPYIAVVFGIHNRDGLSDTIKSFEYYCKKGGSYELRLIGDFESMPNYDELNTMIQHSTFKNRIIILGRQPNNVIPAILVNASILMTTPKYYISGGFPTKLGEYMLSGVPVVATKTGELLDYIEPEKDMLMCEPGDIEAISDALLRIENDDCLAKHLSHNALIKAKAAFCADSYINDFKSFLEL